MKQALGTLEDLGFAVDGGEEDEDFDESDEDIVSDEDDEYQPDSEDDADVSPYGLKPGEKVSHASGGAPRLQNLEEPWQQDKIAEWMGSAAPAKAEKPKKKKSDPELGQLEEGELEALMQDALDLGEVPASSSPPKKKKKLEPPETSAKDDKKKGKKASSSKPVFDLVEPEFTATKSKDKKNKGESAPSTDVDIEALGDPTQLSHTDASDKAGRRRSLRFHTSKIEK